MLHLLAIASGGALGAVLRFLLSSGINAWYGGFPLGTLVVNVLGSFIMGFAFVLFTERIHVGPELRLGLIVGLLGAFTTFSAFSIETIGLLESGAPVKAMLNVIASVALCIGSCWAGLVLARLLGRFVGPGTG